MIFEDRTTDKVIVMERIEGVRMDDIEGITRLGLDRVKLAKAGRKCIFQADPRRRVLSCRSPCRQYLCHAYGQDRFMDFGIVGRVTPELRETMANTFLALIRKDFDGLVDQYIELGLVPEPR